MNIFEGSRRVALVFSCVSAAATMFFVFLEEPHKTFTYSVFHPTGPFFKSSANCPRNAGSHFMIYETKSKKKLSVQLCIHPREFDNGMMLIPYKQNGNEIFGTAIDSPAYKLYVIEKEIFFSMNEFEEKLAEDELREERIDNVKKGIAYLAIFLSVFWAFVSAIGWVVRGFLGIKRGMDSRPNDEKIPEEY